MDVDDEENEEEDKENSKPNGSRNSKKRKSSEMDKNSSSKQARKKQKTDNDPVYKIKIKINSDQIQMDIKKLKLIPFFKKKIDENGKWKEKKYGIYKDVDFKTEDLENLVSYFVEDKDLSHIETIEDLAGFIICCDKFNVKLKLDDMFKEYEDIGNDGDEKTDITDWKDSECKLLQNLYKKLTKNDENNDNEDDENDEEKQEETTKPKSKKRRNRSKPKKSKDIVPSDEDEDGDTHMDDDEDQDKDKKKKTKKKKKTTPKKESKPKLMEPPSKAFRLDGDNDNGSTSSEDDDLMDSPTKKSKRLQEASRDLYTQQPMDEDNGDLNDDDDDDLIADGDDDDEKAQQRREKRLQRKKNEKEKHLKRLQDLEGPEQISLLQTQTIHRLCRSHNIEIREELTKEEKRRKKQIDEFNANIIKSSKSNKKPKDKFRIFKYRHIDDRKLKKALKKRLQIIDKEKGYKSLADIDSVDDIGELRRDTIKRLCKVHHIAANQTINNMIECLEERYENPVDENEFIETLKDVHIDDIKDLDREILVRLCNVYKIETAKKKKKKKRRKKGDDDSDGDESDSDDDLIDVEDEVLIELLEKQKQTMNEAKKKRQTNKIAKLEEAQESSAHMKLRENFLTISGGSHASPSRRGGGNKVHRKKNRNKRNGGGGDFDEPMGFKEDVEGLISLCNMEVTKKGNGWTVVDDVLDPYKVVISEDGARTMKVMMVVARGGSVVSKKWVNHSIKSQRWLPPQDYESKFEKWAKAATESRESRIRKKKRKKTKKKKKDGENEEEEEEEDKEKENEDDDDGALCGTLLGDYSIYVQDRKNVAQPPSLHIKHLAHAAGAHIVNQEWKTETLRKKEIVESEDEEEEEKKKDDKKKSKRGRRGKKNDKKQKEEADDDEDDDIDMNKNNKRKLKGNKQKKTKIKASRSRKQDDDGSDDDDDGNHNKKKKTKRKSKKVQKYAVIISHPSIVGDLDLEEMNETLNERKEENERNKKIKVVSAQWLFDSIEEYKVVGFDKKYNVKPNRHSRSPAH